MGAITVSAHINDIERASPRPTLDERAAVTDDDINAALGAYVPGGSHVYAWLPMKDGWTIHPTAREVIRSAIAAVDKRRRISGDTV